jgi:hypothetical protein
MRAAVLLIVLALHVALIFLFPVLRTSVPRSRDRQAASIEFFLPLPEASYPPEVTPPEPKPGLTGPKGVRRAPRVVESSRATPLPERQPDSKAVTPAPPDWRDELQIAANNELEREARQRQQPSPLAPHDFSGVKPGSTDDSRHEFGWSHAATHRVEGLPGGGWLVNINDNCAIAIVLMIMPVCKIGKIPARGDLFDKMKDAPETRP